MERLTGKIAAVTGAGLGIGRATALLLAREGASVAVLDILDEEACSVADEINSAGGRARFYHMDVSDEPEVAAVMGSIREELGPIDVLVNNAGVATPKCPAHEVESVEFDRVMGVNVKGVLYCTKYAVEQMRQRGGGSIVNIGSMLGMVGAADTSVYVASKAAMRLMSKSDALTYAKDKVRVNVVNPGYVWTPLIEDILKSKGDVDAGRAELESLHPLGRLGTVDDVAYAILYLASDESAFVTGSDLVIDGGYTAR